MKYRVGFAVLFLAHALYAMERKKEQTIPFLIPHPSGDPRRCIILKGEKLQRYFKERIDQAIQETKKRGESS